MRAWIESVILEHPDIAEVAVLGVPDETFGEVVTALVAARQQEAPGGESGSGGEGSAAAVAARPDVGELQRFCRERLAPYQVPKRWQWISALPRNAMGKVNKKELLRLLQAGQLI
ncbi:Malonate--CoA ligase [Tetrabaena socialis]|uniref:Malonate--CoA ligase n=1 Tax=Tetrabaena socialis TaxID=47790 RepID=A0A2J7ZYX6_9CHLO|nr:Malonate--CoA ligase [Tetrabaena socialis]|eukprot:PNH05474.1 Malonate--CoA ligase [Tetrabaena socialis]